MLIAESYKIHRTLEGLFTYKDLYNMDWKEYEKINEWIKGAKINA